MENSVSKLFFRNREYIKTSCAAALIFALFAAFAISGPAEAEQEPAIDFLQLFIYKAQNHFCRDCWNMMTVPSQERLIKYQYDNITKKMKKLGKPVPARFTPEKLKAAFAAGREQAIYDFWENIAQVLSTYEGKPVQYQIMEHQTDRWRIGADSNFVFATAGLWIEKHDDKYLIDLCDFWDVCLIKEQ